MSAVQNSRLSFAKIPKVLDIPDLLIVQKDSFNWFIEEGLKEIFIGKMIPGRLDWL